MPPFPPEIRCMWSHNHSEQGYSPTRKKNKKSGEGTEGKVSFPSMSVDSRAALSPWPRKADPPCCFSVSDSDSGQQLGSVGSHLLPHGAAPLCTAGGRSPEKPAFSSTAWPLQWETHSSAILCRFEVLSALKPHSTSAAFLKEQGLGQTRQNNLPFPSGPISASSWDYSEYTPGEPVTQMSPSQYDLLTTNYQSPHNLPLCWRTELQGLKVQAETRREARQGRKHPACTRGAGWEKQLHAGAAAQGQKFTSDVRSRVLGERRGEESSPCPAWDVVAWSRAPLFPAVPGKGAVLSVSSASGTPVSTCKDTFPEKWCSDALARVMALLLRAHCLPVQILQHGGDFYYCQP